jgi:predicted phosphodiesterase
MRIGLFSDVHGNSVALGAVLERMRALAVDDMICLGDVAYGGPEPRQTLRALRECGCHILKGNGEAWLADAGSLAREPMFRPARLASVREQHERLLAWTRQQLTADDLDFLGGLQHTARFDLGYGKSMLCCHASPRHNFDLIFPTTPTSEVDHALADETADLVAFGHTHQQMLRRHRSATLVNVGSVGRAITHVPWPRWWPAAPDLPGPEAPGQYRSCAEFAVIDAGDDGITIGLHQIPLDRSRVQDTVLRSEMPGGEQFCGELEQF